MSRIFFSTSFGTKFLVFILIFVGLAAFYWFEYRPTKIRQECSWVKKHQDSIPFEPAKTEEQLRAEGVLDDCSQASYVGKTFDFNDFCEHRNKTIIESYKEETPEQPARDWYEKANIQEYEFCIRSKGITK